MVRDNQTVSRRRFVHLGLLGVGTYATPVTARRVAIDDEGDPYDPNAILESTGARAMGTLSSAGTPSAVPDGTILSPDFEWVSPGAPATGNRHALRLTDEGGVDPEYRPETADDLTIDCHVRYHAGSEIAYLFNDVDSTRAGFRAFTNGRAGPGIYCRNVFGGRDISVRRSIQDGEWHAIRIVLDATENALLLYMDGELVGQSEYDGSGWQARDTFRVMGRPSGTATMLEYDRFVVTDRAVRPSEAADPTGTLMHYELESGSGRAVVHGDGASGGGGDGEALLHEKEDLIETIRSDAAVLLPTDRAEELERPAASLLETLSEDETTPLDLLTRLVESETVTRRATEAAVEPTETLAQFAAQLAASMAVGRLASRSLRLGGWAARRLRGILREMRTRCRRVFDLATGRPALGGEVGVALEAVIAEMDRSLAAVSSVHGEDLEALGERLLDEPIESAIDSLPDPAAAALDGAIGTGTDLLARAIYDRYQFADRGDEWSRQDPGAPGIGRSMDAHVEPIQDRIDSAGIGGIAFEHPADARAVRTEAVEEIEDAVSTLTERLAAVDAIAGTAGMLGLVTATVAMGTFTSGVLLSATGVGVVAGATLGAIAAKLSLYAGLFGAVSGALLAGGFGSGVDFLRTSERIHDDAAGRLLALAPSQGGSP